MNIMIVDCFDKFFYDIAETLIEKGHHVSHIATSYILCEDFSNRSCFKNTAFLDRNDFTHSHIINKLNRNNSDCLSKQILEEFMECEHMVLSISDRLSFFPLSVRERKKLYQHLLLYWHSFFKRESIDLLLFSRLPHMAWDTVVYSVAQRQNIPVRYIEQTLFKNRVLLLPPFENLESIPFDYLKNYQKEEINNIIGRSLRDDVFTLSERLRRSNEVNRRALSDKDRFKLTKPNFKESFPKKDFMGFGSFLYERIRRVAGIIKNLVVSAPGLFKEAYVHHAFYFNTHIKNITLDLIAFVFKREIFSLYRFYNRSVTDVNYESKFVFFALHYQPEATTYPLGGVFENQLLAIKILSESIPKDWIIYVKEHPRQFDTKVSHYQRGRKGWSLERKHYRNKEYYRDLLRIKNVKLLHVRENTIELIRKSVFTATITGSVGWQSLLEKKACVNFGNSWYSSCNSCFVVSSVDECKRAISVLLKKLPTEVETDVFKFLAYHKDSFIIAVPTFNEATKSDVKYEVLVDNLVNTIIATSAKPRGESESEANVEQIQCHLVQSSGQSQS